MNQCCHGYCHSTTTPITEILNKDITCAIDIGILTMPTSTTIETTGFTIGLLRNATTRAGLGSVLFGDSYGFDTDSLGLVLDEVCNFAKVPRVQLLIIPFPIVDVVSDTREITNDDGINLQG